MPRLERDDSSINYEEVGSGYPLLLIAPGGMNSAMDWWARAAFDPRETYRDEFRLIAMDQRNAGGSTGALNAGDPWGSYLDDQLALMDHLGHRTFHVMGCCIGCSFALGLAARAPDRVTAAVLEQPIGIVEDNRELFLAMGKEWGDRLVETRSDVDAGQVAAFTASMWTGEFVLSVSRDAVRSTTAPLLVLPGIDAFHPGETGREVARLAPNAEIMEPWKDSPELIAQAVERVRSFLARQTPVASR